MSDMDDIEYKIAKLQLSPGDILVIKVSQRLTEQAYERLRAAAKQTIGDDAKVMVIEGAISLSILTRADIDRAAA